MTDYGGKIEEILHELSQFVAFSCRFRRCFDHRIARHGKVEGIQDTCGQSASFTSLINASYSLFLCLLQVTSRLGCASLFGIDIGVPTLFTCETAQDGTTRVVSLILGAKFHSRFSCPWV